tara:strand:+ start:391 stop:642 length:252 start_codon:yes stop_codon:yes gene_type:complete
MEIPNISTLFVEVSSTRTETAKDDIQIFSDGKRNKMIARGWINNRHNMCTVFLNEGFEWLDSDGEYVTELQNAIEERELEMEY